MNKTLLVLSLTLLSTTVLADNKYSGPYVGVTAGYVDGTDKNSEYVAGVFDGYTAKTSPDGGLLGLVAGFNTTLQNNIVLGVEADYEYRDADDTAYDKFLGVTDAEYPMQTELERAASLRARVGYLFNNDKTLAYLTGGYARAKIKRTYGDNGSQLYSQSVTDWQGGWTAGVGIEHLVTDVLSIQMEYRYTDYQDTNLNADEIYGPFSKEKQEYDEQSLRVGVMYHF